MPAVFASEKTAPAAKPAPKAASGLAYPSPLLGVPGPATSSREIEIVFDRKSAGSREALKTGKARLQMEAANKIAPLAKTDAENRDLNTRTYRRDVQDAEEEYTRAIRRAQSKRDHALAKAKEDRDDRAALHAAEFSDATTTIERELKSSIYMLESGAADVQEQLTAEFKTYHGAAKEVEEAKRKADAEAKAVKDAEDAKRWAEARGTQIAAAIADGSIVIDLETGEVKGEGAEKLSAEEKAVIVETARAAVRK